MLTYCFESAYVARTLAKCRKNDLAVVDTEGHEKAVREYDGWNGEYCVNPTAKEWQVHCIKSSIK